MIDRVQTNFMGRQEFDTVLFSCQNIVINGSNIGLKLCMMNGSNVVLQGGIMNNSNVELG